VEHHRPSVQMLVTCQAAMNLARLVCLAPASVGTHTGAGPCSVFATLLAGFTPRTPRNEVRSKPGYGGQGTLTWDGVSHRAYTCRYSSWCTANGCRGSRTSLDTLRQSCGAGCRSARRAWELPAAEHRQM